MSVDSGAHGRHFTDDFVARHPWQLRLRQLTVHQVQVGARHIELAITNMSATPEPGKGRLGFEDNGSGKAQLIIRWANGQKTILATEP